LQADYESKHKPDLEEAVQKHIQETVASDDAEE
jgi:hypothetical protein